MLLIINICSKNCSHVNDGQNREYSMAMKAIVNQYSFS